MMIELMDNAYLIKYTFFYSFIVTNKFGECAYPVLHNMLLTK